MAFKDYFSTQSDRYTRFRPHYPRALFEFLSSLPTATDRAWDCGTGNGQAALDLAGFFSQVIATDPSANQIKHAQLHSRVSYLVCTAEQCPLADHLVDLITVALAIHWFDFERFYAQVRRVGRAGSFLAAWSYGLVSISPEVDRAVRYLYADVLGEYWPPERKLIDQGYATIPFPFDEVAAPAFDMQAQWKLDDLIGYLGTWSSTQRFIERHGVNPLDAAEVEIRNSWGPSESPRQVHWPLYLRVGRVESANDRVT